MNYIIFYLVTFFISFLLYSVEQIYKNDQYTKRDLYMALLISSLGPTYIGLCILSMLLTILVIIYFKIENFVRDKDMYADVILISHARFDILSDVFIALIKKWFK